MAQMVQGMIVHGRGQGRSLGFPTANLELSNDTPPPPEGIWAAWARLTPNPTWYKAAAHIGPRPTIAGAPPTVELHLLRFPDQDLYGRQLTFILQERLRDITKFATLKELRAAIDTDCKRAEQLLITPPS